MYSSSKSPLLLTTATLCMQETVAEGQTFIRYALSQPNVYFVTMKTLIQWMIQPVKSEDMPAWLKSQYKHLHTTKTQTKAYKGKPPPSASDSQLEEAKGQNPQVGVDVYRQQALSSSRNVAFLLLSFLCLQVRVLLQLLTYYGMHFKSRVHFYRAEYYVLCSEKEVSGSPPTINFT